MAFAGVNHKFVHAGLHAHNLLQKSSRRFLVAVSPVLFHFAAYKYQHIDDITKEAFQIKRTDQITMFIVLLGLR